MSNVIEVVLPLETADIVLPGDDERQDQEELYQEYVSIQEGSGYLAAMDGKPLPVSSPALDTSAAVIFSWWICCLSSFLCDHLIFILKYYHLF